MAVALALWPLPVALAEPLAQPLPDPCVKTPLGESLVTAVADSRTLVLEDGRPIRLTGIEWAVPPDQARAILSESLLRRRVRVSAPKAEPDRHGRLHAFPIVSGSETPIQYEWLGRGLALVNGGDLDKACADALRAAEKTARASGVGAFAPGGRGVLHAGDPGSLLAQKGGFALVEGKVLSVREAGSTIYVNFGRRWSEDFTVTIAKRRLPAFISGGLAPKSLAGQTVRVRGFLEERGGPWIEAASPAQFETAGHR